MITNENMKGANKTKTKNILKIIHSRLKNSHFSLSQKFEATDCCIRNLASYYLLI